MKEQLIEAGDATAETVHAVVFSMLSSLALCLLLLVHPFTVEKPQNEESSSWTLFDNIFQTAPDLSETEIPSVQVQLQRSDFTKSRPRSPGSYRSMRENPVAPIDAVEKAPEAQPGINKTQGDLQQSDIPNRRPRRPDSYRSTALREGVVGPVDTKHTGLEPPSATITVQVQLQRSDFTKSRPRSPGSYRSMRENPVAPIDAVEKAPEAQSGINKTQGDLQQSDIPNRRPRRPDSYRSTALREGVVGPVDTKHTGLEPPSATITVQVQLQRSDFTKSRPRSPGSYRSMRENPVAPIDAVEKAPEAQPGINKTQGDFLRPDLRNRPRSPHSSFSTCVKKCLVAPKDTLETEPEALSVRLHSFHEQLFFCFPWGLSCAVLFLLVIRRINLSERSEELQYDAMRVRLEQTKQQVEEIKFKIAQQNVLLAELLARENEADAIMMRD